MVSVVLSSVLIFHFLFFKIENSKILFSISHHMINFNLPTIFLIFPTDPLIEGTMAQVTIFCIVQISRRVAVGKFTVYIVLVTISVSQGSTGYAAGNIQSFTQTRHFPWTTNFTDLDYFGANQGDYTVIPLTIATIWETVTLTSMILSIWRLYSKLVVVECI
jgi:hypothetical protein